MIRTLLETSRRSSTAGTFSVVCALAATVFVLACAAPAEDAPAATTASVDEQALRLYVLDCGNLVLHDVSLFNVTAEEAATDELFVPCYLIEHPQGRLLWDLGLPLTVRSGEYSAEGADLALERSVVEQLAELELAPEDIDYIAMSHLHFDHCGQAADFAGAHHLIQRAEYDAAFADPVVVPAFEPELYAALRDSETTLLDGDHDVFGDGRVVIRSAPGHTPGHQVLFVDLEQTGPILLSGDLYHFRANRELRRPPLFNVDADATLASMEAVEAFLAESGARLWIEHDAALAASLAKSPSFHE